ncbi:MAG: LysR family transcriptional regulator [Oscillospiraceae bacterium]
MLDTFLAVSDCGSFSKAADKLFILPTAVMKKTNASFPNHKLHLVPFADNHEGILSATIRRKTIRKYTLRIQRSFMICRSSTAARKANRRAAGA